MIALHEKKNDKVSCESLVPFTPVNQANSIH